MLLADVVRNARPTTLIGVSGQPGAFSEPIVRMMAEINRRPVIFPLSNPTSRAEATPQDLERWSEGRAVIGTGSPFPPLMRSRPAFKVDQTNNSYIFPGVGLGAIAVQARRVTDTMFMAAAKALAAMSPAKRNPNGNLLPPVDRASRHLGRGRARRRGAGHQGRAHARHRRRRDRRGDRRQDVDAALSAVSSRLVRSTTRLCRHG